MFTVSFSGYKHRSFKVETQAEVLQLMKKYKECSRSMAVQVVVDETNELSEIVKQSEKLHFLNTKIFVDRNYLRNRNYTLTTIKTFAMHDLLKDNPSDPICEDTLTKDQHLVWTNRVSAGTIIYDAMNIGPTPIKDNIIYARHVLVDIKDV